jgi:peptidoglycan/xylan/chitin deacetylase (PgdA/CDA1 family)
VPSRFGEVRKLLLLVNLNPIYYTKVIIVEFGCHCILALEFREKLMGKLSKGNQVAAIADRFGFVSMLLRFPHRPSLVVLNYHRIGDWENTEWDSGVFSADAPEFRFQISYLKSKYPILDLEQALAFVGGHAKLAKTSVLITFDDGYIDNYQTAFPILRELGVPATFFLVTSLIGTNQIPWWDAIAYMLKRCRRPLISITYPTSCTFRLDRNSVSSTIASLLRLYNSAQVMDGERFISALESATGERRPASSERRFLNWQEARAMLACGMSVSSHTDTHEAMSKRTLAEQTEDLIRARTILQDRLQVDGNVLAYPYGSKGSFNLDTLRALEQAGYRAAFSFYGGFNLPGRTEHYDIRRFSMNPHTTRQRLRLQMAVAATTARWWL